MCTFAVLVGLPRDQSSRTQAVCRSPSTHVSHSLIWFQPREHLVHQTFIPTLNRPQVAECRCGYGGSNKAVSVERDRKEQLLEPLPLFE